MHGRASVRAAALGEAGSDGQEELAVAHRNGTLQEVFGSGTAAVISPVGELFYKGESIIVPERSNSICDRLFRSITGIQ